MHSMARDSHHCPVSARRRVSQRPDRSVFPSISNFKRDRSGGQELGDCEYLQFLGRRKNQKVSFKPSFITRLLSHPTRGFHAPTSGGAPPHPHPPWLG